MPAQAVTTAPAGWFGKLPALGDFASRRLDPAWVDAWDGWLQQELVRARAEAGDDAWLAAYLVAPVRRFWLAPGLLAPAAWLGVLMPSVDSVGRHFPFTLAAPLPPGGDDLLDALADSGWLDAADLLAREVLDPGFGIDALEHGVARLPAPHGERRVDELAGAPLVRELRARHGALRSAWWCEGATAAEAFVCSGALPTGAAFDALWRDAG